jgi:DNA polymerase-3 subunit alpha
MGASFVKIDFKDEKTWDLYAEGRTKGIFQLESQLGKTWSKRLQPRNIEELSALIAIIRPGTLKAIQDGKSMTWHYVDRKHGRDPVAYYHPALEPILNKTHGVLVYQEQAMLIAKELAGFDLKGADELRKAIGKKKADVMAKVRIKFIDGCDKKGIVSVSEAQEIFNGIEKSARYSFNKSHSVSYAIDSYWSAWWKANYTKEYFLAMLYYAHEKQDPHREIYEIISEAKLFDIEVKVPNLKHYSRKFEWFNNKIYFGVKDMKSLAGVTGDKVIASMQQAEALAGKKPADFNWMDVLVYLSPVINSIGFKTLASVGFFSTDVTGLTRNRALYEYLIFKNLTATEEKWVVENYPKRQWTSLKACLTDLAPTKKEGGGTFNADRSQKVKDEIRFIDNPPYDLDDDPQWIIDQEVKFLGCPISMSRVEVIDTSAANTSCKDILNGKWGENIAVIANIARLGTYKTKKGKNAGEDMAFLTLEDESCSIDSCVVFPEAKKKYDFLLYEGANLMFVGEVTKQDNSFIIQKIHEI